VKDQTAPGGGAGREAQATGGAAPAQQIQMSMKMMAMMDAMFKKVSDNR
jgi:hypothetical protein